MASTVKKIDIWVGFVHDKPGELAQALETLKGAGADIEFMFARSVGGKAVYFVAPLKGAAQLKAAKKLRLVKTNATRSLRIEAPDRRGIGLKIVAALGAAGINLRGFSAMGIGGKALFYVALARNDLAKAQRDLKKAL